MKTILLLIISALFLFSSCKKMDKKANDFILGNTFEIISLKVDDTEQLTIFLSDSCVCKKMYFSEVATSSFLNAYSVYFSECSNAPVPDLFSSIDNYTILKSTTVKPRKFAFISFNNFSQSEPLCSCGRFGTATYFTITDVDEKKNTFTYEADLPDGKWSITAKKI